METVEFDKLVEDVKDALYNRENLGDAIELITDLDHYDKADVVVEALGMKITKKYKGYLSHFEEDRIKNVYRDVYRITISKNKKRFSFDFGNALIKSGEPSNYDILTSLEKYDPEYFEAFCSNYGLSTDSRIAYKTFKAVEKQYLKLVEMFDWDEIDLMREII